MLLKNAQYVVGLMMRFKKNIRTGVVARMTCPSTKPARHTKKDALLNSHGAISTACHSLIPVKGNPDRGAFTSFVPEGEPGEYYLRVLEEDLKNGGSR